MESSADERSERLAIGAVVAVSALIRFFGLARQSLWVDELLSVRAFDAPSGVSFGELLLHNVHGPLYSLFMHFWSMIAGTDAWLRIPSALAGTAAVYLMYRWLVALGRRDLAIPAALFMALSPFHLYYSQEVRFYSFLALLVVITLTQFERFRAAPSLKTGAILGFGLGLACLAHLSGLFLGAALALYLLFSRSRGGDHLRFGAVAALIALLMISPWVYREIVLLRTIRVVDISSMPVEERLRGELTMSSWSYPYALYAFSAGYSLGPSLRELHATTPVGSLFSANAPAFIITGLVFGALLISGIVRSSGGGHLGLFLSVIIVTGCSVGLATALNVKVFNVRYLMCAFPFFMALLAYGLPAGRAPRIAAAAAVCGIMLVSDWNYHFNDRYARDDVRSAVETVSRNEEPGDIVLVPTVGFVFERYYRGSGEAVIFPPAPESAGMEGTIRRYFNDHPRVWYLASRSWDYDPRGLMPEILSRQGRLVRSWEYPGTSLKLYVRNTH